MPATKFISFTIDQQAFELAHFGVDVKRFVFTATVNRIDANGAIVDVPGQPGSVQYEWPMVVGGVVQVPFGNQIQPGEVGTPFMRAMIRRVYALLKFKGVIDNDSTVVDDV